MNNEKLEELKGKINELERNLSIENICELKRLYNVFNQKKFNADNTIDIRSYTTLMTEINTIMFNMIKSENNVSSNESIRKMVESLNISWLMIDNLISINDYVFVIGESIRDFSRKQKAYLIDDDLKEIKNIIFDNDERKIFSIEKFSIIDKILSELNSEMGKLDLDCEEDYPYLYLDKNEVYYNTPNLHIYLSSSLLDIVNSLVSGLTKNVEIVIEDNAKNFYILNMKIANYKYTIEKTSLLNIWSLQEVLKAKTKSLKK